MDYIVIRNDLDKLIVETTEYDKNTIPKHLLSYLSKWKWGQYGWVSPASLMYTAAWRKLYFPEVDCCKIWASDENNKAIPGGYSIRSDDESVSIPILAKYDLCEGFCSPNSGMQGSRAIEKMRNLKRLNRDFDSAQRTLFDLKLFATIMNEINDLNHDQLLELLKFFICTAKEIKAKRDEENNKLNSGNTASFDLIETLSGIHDPELTKCVVASCYQAIFTNKGLMVEGIGDNKTAADARAKKPGDLRVEKDGIPLIAIEVKDKTQTIDWNNIERALRIIKAHSDLESFVFVLESRDAATNTIVNEMVKSDQLSKAEGRLISIMSLYSLYQMTKPICNDHDLIIQTSKNISIASSIKPDTRQLWIEKIKGDSEKG